MQYKKYKDRKSSKEKGESIKYKTDFRFIQNYEASMDEKEKEKYEKNGKTFLQHFLDEKDSSGCTALQNAILRYYFLYCILNYSQIRSDNIGKLRAYEGLKNLYPTDCGPTV